MTMQGYTIDDNVIYQDNQSAILLEKNGRGSSGQRTHHIDIWYFFVTDRVKRGEIHIEYCLTRDMVADFFTKHHQGSLFWKLRAIILNIPGCAPSTGDAAASQECVGKVMSYADMVRGMHRKSSDVDDVMCQLEAKGRIQKTGMRGGNLSFLSANW